MKHRIFELYNLFLKRTFIEKINVIQNILAKNVIGVKNFSRLLHELKIELVL